MPYVPVNIVLERPLAPGGTLSIPYPEGRNQGHFFSGINHTLAVDGTFYRCPRDFLITTLMDRISLSWHAEVQLPARSVLNIQLEIPGSDFYYDPKNSVTVMNMVSSPMFMINLGAPTAPEEQHYFERQVISAPQTLKLRYDRTDYARNIVIYSTHPNQQCTFLVEGLDIYGRPMKERFLGAAVGNKAFSRVSRITPSHPCEGEVWIGTGDKLGLPVFLPAPGYLIREIITGQTVTGGMVAYGDLNMPSPSSGDSRGTYTPPKGIKLDSKNIIHLLVSLPNPSNLGLAEIR